MGSFLSTRNNSGSWQATDRTVLITGASSGIGRQLALLYAAEGANLALMARRRDVLQQVAEDCRSAGSPKVHLYTADLTKNTEIAQSTQQAIRDFGQFDVLILNAGRSQGHFFEEIKDVEQMDYLLKLNVSGVINTLHYLLPYLHKSEHSRIVVVSSTAGIIPVPYRTVYCASKFALSGFSNAIRMELCETYKEASPKVCLINFPEVSGTALNTSRMDFGADQPPFGFDGSQAVDVETACRNMMVQVARGTREWGHPFKVSLLRPFYSIIPSVLEAMIMKHVRRTHVRQPAK